MTEDNKRLLEAYKREMRNPRFHILRYYSEEISRVITRRMRQRRLELDRKLMSQVTNTLNRFRQFDGRSFRFSPVEQLDGDIQLADDKIPMLTETFLVKGDLARRPVNRAFGGLSGEDAIHCIRDCFGAEGLDLFAGWFGIEDVTDNGGQRGTAEAESKAASPHIPTWIKCNWHHLEILLLLLTAIAAIAISIAFTAAAIQ